MLNRKNNEVTVYNPFREMEKFEKNFFGDPFGFFGGNSIDEFKTDITDEGDHYKLQADLPGFDKKDIHLDLSDGILSINAERHSEHEEKDKKGKFIRCERSYGSYSRRFDLSDIEEDKIKAKYDNGVLTLTMPKKEVTVKSGRQLEIE